MNRLFAFELKKILCRRITLAGLAAVLLLNLLLIVTTCGSVAAYDYATGESATGRAAIAMEQQIAARYQGELDDAKVRQMLADFDPSQAELERLRGVNIAYVSINAQQSVIHRYFAEIDGSWNGQTVSGVFGDQPIMAGYTAGWLGVSDDLVKVFTALFVVLLVMLTPVFCGEYGGVDSLILTARYGRTKCCTAKAAAALAAALSVTVFFIALNLAAGLLIYGTAGLDGSILYSSVAYSHYIPYNISCLTLLAYQAMLALTGAVTLTGVALAVSAISKTPVSALAVSMVLLLAPVFLPVTEASPFYRLLTLLPLYHAQFVSLMSVAQTPQGWLYALWAIPVALAAAVLGGLLARLIFARHEVR